jgi:hypothetical protein
MKTFGPYVWNNCSWVKHTLSTWFWHKNRVWHMFDSIRHETRMILHYNLTPPLANCSRHLANHSKHSANCCMHSDSCCMHSTSGCRHQSCIYRIHWLATQLNYKHSPNYSRQNRALNNISSQWHKGRRQLVLYSDTIIRSGPQHTQFIFLGPLPPLGVRHVWYYSAISFLIYGSTVLTTLLRLIQTRGTSYQAEMLHYLMFHPMNQQKDCHNGLTSSDCVEANLRLTKSNIYNFSHTLLVLLPSTHTFQVHTRLKEHFATCTSFVYKQFYFFWFILLWTCTQVC